MDGFCDGWSLVKKTAQTEGITLNYFDEVDSWSGLGAAWIDVQRGYCISKIKYEVILHEGHFAFTLVGGLCIECHLQSFVALTVLVFLGSDFKLILRYYE